MSQERMSELRCLEGRQVSVALADGSRIDDCQLVSAGRYGTGTVWLFSDGAWRPRGSLDRAKKTALPFNRHAAIADLIWIGNPAIESERSSCGGTVLGFRVD